MAIPKLTINFGAFALAQDLVFGLCIFAEPGEWVPFCEGSPEEQAWVRRHVADHPFRRCLTSGMEATLFPTPAPAPQSS